MFNIKDVLGATEALNKLANTVDKSVDKVLEIKQQELDIQGQLALITAKAFEQFAVMGNRVLEMAAESYKAEREWQRTIKQLELEIKKQGHEIECESRKLGIALKQIELDEARYRFEQRKKSEALTNNGKYE
jgi:hypothetical protein